MVSAYSCNLGLARQERKRRSAHSLAVGRTLRPLWTFDQREEIAMNWDQVEGNWKQLKGKVKEQWGKLTDDQLDVIAGKRDQLAGKIQEVYGVTKEEAERQLADWEKH
jgi:uncharacterized protein YjbJ (UPF0337 family)